MQHTIVCIHLYCFSNYECLCDFAIQKSTKQTQHKYLLYACAHTTTAGFDPTRCSYFCSERRTFITPYDSFNTMNGQDQSHLIQPPTLAPLLSAVIIWLHAVRGHVHMTFEKPIKSSPSTGLVSSFEKDALYSFIRRNFIGLQTSTG